MTNNTDNSKTFVYKIGLIGPSRVGKTSTITAILSEAQELLAGTSVSIKAIGGTKTRIDDNYNKLKGSLIAGKFEHGSLEGTQEPYKFELAMTVLDSNKELRFSILDYPGGWLQNCPLGRDKDWEECKQWIEDSTVLIIPIDATIVMESDSQVKQDCEAANDMLAISQAKDVVREWAKKRKVKNETGLLLLVPIKCESYFNDNGGNKNESEKLFKMITDVYYSELIDAASQEFGGSFPKESFDNKETRFQKLTRGILEYLTDEQVNDAIPSYGIQYHPVDTIGCVEIKFARWNHEQEKSLFDSEYMVRSPGKYRSLGAKGLFIAICRQIVKEQFNKQGFFGNLWGWLRGDNQNLVRIIKELSNKELGMRVKNIAIR